MTQPKLRMRLGDLLVNEGIITEEQLKQALAEQRNSGKKLGDQLIAMKFITEDQLLNFLARQLNIPFLDLLRAPLNSQVVALLPEVHARRLRALVISADDLSVTVAMSDPADLTAFDTLSQLLSPRTVSLAIARENQLLNAFDRFYRRTREIESFAEQLHEEYSATEEFDLLSLTGEQGEDNATVAKLLHSLFEDAVQVGASDIHIEPDEKLLRIRQRVDGVLQENILQEVRIASALVLRLKLMAGLDISEKRLPQDGRFSLTIRDQSIDVRLSTMPVSYGESVVMRLLNQSAGLLTLDETGMPPQMIQRFRRQLKRPHGMIVVTGPTGSGKTTTLYGALSELNEPGKKIITVEDPVEYRLPRISQVQVNPKIGLNFSHVLRTALRQDPDILLVGEMRDHETVEIGMRGAMTGHLVMTTLHTNDAITSALRLIDMGAPGYLVASTLRAIIAQRLVRRLCPNCRQPHHPDASERVWLEKLAGYPLNNEDFYQAKGCQSCNYTGYKGRIGVFELLELNEAMIEALRINDTHGFAKQARLSPHFSPLSLSALEYAREGMTTIDEVLKLVEEVELMEETGGNGHNSKDSGE